MIRPIISSTLFLFVAALNVLAQSTDSIRKLPPAFVPRQSNVDVRHIALDLRFDWAKRQAAGTATITFAPHKTTKSIALDAGKLTINSIKSTKGSALKFAYDGGDSLGGLRITLDRSYAANETLSVIITYHTNWINEADPNNLWGTFGKGLRFQGQTSTDPLRRKHLWSMGDPQSNRYWFPCIEEPHDLRTTECKLTVDKPLTAISNGTLASTIENADQTKTYHWKSEKPYPNFLTSVVVGEYVEVKQSANGVPLVSYSFPDEVAATTASVERLPEMVKYFSQMTGAAYPYSRYSQVFVQDYAGFTGNHMVSTITENMVDDDRTHDDFLYLWDPTESEALARQWFGNSVAIGNWRDAWLTNSLAHYFSCLFTEFRDGKAEHLLFRRTWDLNTLYFGDWSSGNRRPIVTDHFENIASYTSDNYSVVRGALVLHMLRKELGDDIWWKGIKSFVANHANTTVTTSDFIKSFERASGQSLNWFFDQWIYRMGHPVFEVVKSYDAKKKELTLMVTQQQVVDTLNEYPQTEFFQGKVAIGIDSRIEIVRLDAQKENRFTFSSPQEPQLVNFDYEGTWIKELTLPRTLDELLYQFQNDSDIAGRNTAMGELVARANDTALATSDRNRIITSFRAVIASDLYWRFRMNALSQLQGLLAPPADTLPPVFDAETRSMLLAIIKSESSWLRTAAIRFLGMSKDSTYADLYLSHLNDKSDRVINAAAIALGKTRSSKAFDALAKLVSKPSWKNQSLISSLWGLRELADPRGYDIAYTALTTLDSPHWTLATPVWDYRVIAAMTIKVLGRSADAYPFLNDAFKKSVAEDDVHGMFYNAFLSTNLADPRGQEIYDSLRGKFKDDANAIAAVDMYEGQFKAALGK